MVDSRGDGVGSGGVEVINGGGGVGSRGGGVDNGGGGVVLTRQGSWADKQDYAGLLHFPIVTSPFHYGVTMNQI